MKWKLNAMDKNVTLIFMAGEERSSLAQCVLG